MQAEHPENNNSAVLNDHAAAVKPLNTGLLLKLLTGLLLVMFPVGFIIMFTEAGKPYLWTTTIFLGLEALIMFLVLIRLADLLSVVITTAVIFMASWFIEYWGVTTGIPFGSYSYSRVLSPLIGGVPLAIMFAWYIVTASSLITARTLLKGSSEIAAVSVAAVFILATDILLEPFASFINNFWIWNNSAIPMQNFVSWLVIGILFTSAVSQLIKWHNIREYRSGLHKIPLVIVIINIINFSAVNIYYGYYAITFFGVLHFIVLAAAVKLFTSKKSV